VSYDTYRSMLAAATGLSLSEGEFLLIGERIWNLIRLFNLREGWTQDQAGVPQRFKEALPSGVMKGHAFTDRDIAVLLKQYNTARGWDDSGRPTAHTLPRLGIDALMEPLFEGK
jgi:aldehyde:ferredoxin oxidoreductase